MRLRLVCLKFWVVWLLPLPCPTCVDLPPLCLSKVSWPSPDSFTIRIGVWSVLQRHLKAQLVVWSRIWLLWHWFRWEATQLTSSTNYKIGVSKSLSSLRLMIFAIQPWPKSLSMVTGLVWLAMPIDCTKISRLCVVTVELSARSQSSETFQNVRLSFAQTLVECNVPFTLLMTTNLKFASGTFTWCWINLRIMEILNKLE